MGHAYTQTADEASSGKLVEARNLACRRGGRWLLEGLNFGVRAGESLLFAGPNGAGKSSLLRLIAGLLPIAAGELQVRVVSAMCDENLALDGNATLGSALGLWAAIDGAGGTALDAALDAMALGSLRDVPVRLLSTGQRKRAMLARVIASGAPLWLLDEPGNGLDGTSLDLLGTAMGRHVAGGGGIIAASHFTLPFAFCATLNLAEHQP